MYNIQSTIPKHITIKPKENIESLTGIVIKPKYHLSIEDYLTVNISINGVVETLNLINYYYGNLDFSSASSLSNGIDNIITSLFVNINLLNGVPISTSLLQNIKVLKKFTINEQRYVPNSYNKGNIELLGRYIPGVSGDYVNTFNGHTGDVSGAIELVRMNNTVQLLDENGVVYLNGLMPKDKYVAKINNRVDNIYLIKEIKYNDIISTANSSNHGEVNIPHEYFYLNENNNIQSLLDLINTDLTNDQSAIHKHYFVRWINNNDLIVQGTLSNENNFTLEPNYFPLHFYTSEGVLSSISWTLATLLNGKNKITLSLTFTGMYTAMKRDLEVSVSE